MMTNAQKQTLHEMTALELEKREGEDLSGTGVIAKHFELADEMFLSQVGLRGSCFRVCRMILSDRFSK